MSAVKRKCKVQFKAQSLLWLQTVNLSHVEMHRQFLDTDLYPNWESSLKSEGCFQVTRKFKVNITLQIVWCLGNNTICGYRVPQLCNYFFAGVTELPDFHRALIISVSWYALFSVSCCDFMSHILDNMSCIAYQYCARCHRLISHSFPSWGFFYVYQLVFPLSATSG